MYSSIWVKDEFTFNDLKRQCWSGAIDTLEKIEEHGKETELMQLIDDIFASEVPTLTSINDFLWFDSDFVFESLNIENLED